MRNYPFKDHHLSVIDFKKLPNQKLYVPFKIIDINNNGYSMKYKVGFIGCNKNNKNEVYPVTGWIVSPDTKDEKEEDGEEDDENLVKIIPNNNNAYDDYDYGGNKDNDVKRYILDEYDINI